MREEIAKKHNIYKVFNDIALKNEIVIFGSDFAAGFPFYELSKKHLLSNAIYNRSIEGITISEVCEILDECVFKAHPSKVFYIFKVENENDLNCYKKILEKTKTALSSSKIYILSSPSEAENSNINTALKSIVNEYNAEYISIDYSKDCETIYRRLSPFFRNGKITFSEAFQLA